MSSRAPRAALLAVIALLLVTETALSPYYPALFRQLYGIDDPGATGVYIWACRLSAVVALPLWGRAAKRWPLPRLVMAGLSCAILLDAALGFAPTYAAFTALSATVAATSTSLLLAYPALVALDEGRGDRLPGVRLFVAVFHAGTVVATLVGAVVMTLPNPRLGISSFALLDAALLWLCLRVLDHQTSPAPVGPQARARAAPRRRLLLAVTSVAVVFELATNVIRPFFVEYTTAGGFGISGGAVLFLLPNAAVLAVLPAAAPIRRRLGPGLLPAAFGLAAAGLALQASTLDLAPLGLGRILYGVGLGLGHVALDLRMFDATGTAGPGYAAVETARGAALLVTPLLAAAAASSSLALPLLLGAGLFALGAALAPYLSLRPAVEETVVAAPSH